MTEKIRRQHETTLMSELHGMRCARLLAVRSIEDQSYIIFYLRARGAWHRFYLDAGVLFWLEGQPPDREDDLFGGCEYVDMGQNLQIEGKIITKIEMDDSTLVFQIENRTLFKLIYSFQSDCTDVIVG